MRWIAAIGVMVGLLCAPAMASARHRSTTYCSPSGDICQSTTNLHGIRTLRISLAARYFTRYRLCVRAPGDTATCHGFRVHRRGGVFSSSVKWAAQFPPSGHGRYEVAWKSMPGAVRVGRVLGFHVV